MPSDADVIMTFELTNPQALALTQLVERFTGTDAQGL